MTSQADVGRDLRGSGRNPVDPKWPDDARVAVQFVLNYEEGAEKSVMLGDETSEAFMTEVPIGEPIVGGRNRTSESLYDYGARVGVWRVLRLFEERQLPLTVFAVGLALELNPDVGAACAEAGHEVASHAYRWIDYRNVPIDVEREHVQRCVDAITNTTGTRPVGWFTGRISPNTRKLVAEEGGFIYDSDAYDDDLPYWERVEGKNHLVVPYAFDTNDMKFSVSPGAFTSNDDFLSYLIDTFDMLYGEGTSSPKMMSVGLHARVVGRPGRAMPVARFLDHVIKHDHVWVCRRDEIARHWAQHHPPAQ